MNANGHPDALELQALVDDELAPDAVERVAAHCAACAACGAALAELREVGALLADAPAPELPRTVWHRVAAARRRDAAPLSRSFKLALTAACAAGILLGLRFGPVKFRAETPSDDTENVAEGLWGGGSGDSLLSIYTSATVLEG